MGIQINEIFESIEGEGIRTGYIATFIRTQFCNLKCSYCDTKYSWEACDDSGEQQYVVMSIEEIIDKCFEFGNKKVTLTGGEPLIQKEAPELVAALLENGFEVNIETNGAVDLTDFESRMVDILSDDELVNNLIYTLDYKCPSSGEEEKMIMDNITFLVKGDCLKFVVGTQEDLQHMKSVVDQYVPNPITFEVYVSPVFGQITGAEIVQFMRDNRMTNVRAQVQLHKIYWDPETRGV